MEVSLVVAASRNRVIGRGGALPWHLPGDLRHFKALTMGKPILMGRKTWDALPRRPLPGRDNFVLSRGAEAGSRGGATWFRDLAAALEACRMAGAAEACVIGGEQVFREALPLADRIHFTLVDAEIEGDAFMPPFGDGWREANAGPWQTENGIAYRCIDFVRAG